MTDDTRKSGDKKMPAAVLPERFLASLLALTVLGAVVALGAVFRLADLGNRPMHCDEANHADKFRLLLEDDHYVYDPNEYHGPSLNYLTLGIAWLTGKEKLTEITETDLRLLPALFGIALIGLVWFLREELGTAAILWAAVLTALSPAMVFYSRYYIQEMLLVTFTFGAIIAGLGLKGLKGGLKGVRTVFCGVPRRKRKRGRKRRKRGLTPFLRNRRLKGGLKGGLKGVRTLFCGAPRMRQIFWLVMLGVCLGMMHASKETCVIAIFCLARAAMVYGRRKRGRKRGQTPFSPPFSPFSLFLWKRWKRGLTPFIAPFIVVFVAGGVSMLFFSSFFANPAGIVDSVTTYFVYLGRSSGEGSVGRHVYPWHYYLSHLFWFDRGEGPVWTELSIAVLALVGLVAGLLGRGLDKEDHVPMVRMLSSYTVLMMLIYCAIPYKTPWCALGFLHGMILLAGVGAAVLIRVAPRHVAKTLVVVLLVAMVGHLAWQAHRASFVEFEDTSNPYVYSHTTNDVPELCERVEEIARLHGDGHDMHIQVLTPDADHWPLPWYLRRFTRVGWWSKTPEGPTAPLIIMQPAMLELFLEYNYSQPPGQQYTYVPFPREKNEPPWQLRPNVPLQMYMRLKLRDRYLADREAQRLTGHSMSQPPEAQ